MLAFKRILLKLSGEALAGDKGFGVETAGFIPSRQKSETYISSA